MPDIEKLNDVAAADIEAVNGVAKANIQAINGVDVPASGQTATRWVAAFDGNGQKMYIAYAAHSDRTSWTGTEVNNSTPHNLWIAYGKDGSGNSLWVVTTDSGSMEIAHDDNNDVTDGSDWTKVSNDSAGNDIEKLWTVEWGNDVWIGAGITTGASGGQEIYRSTDGATWARIDLSSVSGIGTTHIYGCASDGAGSWMIGQGSKIFASTDNGQNWAEMTSYPGTAVADIGFTNNTWVVLGAASPGNINTVGAAAFATEMGGGSAATWGEQDAKVSNDGTTHGEHQINVTQTGSGRSRLACGGGVAVIGHTAYTLAFDINGTTIGIRSATGLSKDGNQNGIVRVSGGSETGQPIIDNTINTIATDGNGVFLVGSDAGDVAESTDNGASWTQIVNGFTYNGNRKFEAIRANVYLPV
jgi:hypothetical protein